MNTTKPVIFQFFVHLISFVVAVLVKFYCFTSLFVPYLEAKSVVPELATRDSEHCWWSSLFGHSCYHFIKISMRCINMHLQISTEYYVLCVTFSNTHGYGLTWKPFPDNWPFLCGEPTGQGRLNIKMSSYQYRDSHVKDKTVSRPSYL